MRKVRIFEIKKSTYIRTCNVLNVSYPLTSLDDENTEQHLLNQSTLKTLLGIHDEATYNLGQMTGNCQSPWYELNVSKKNKRLHIFVKGLAILFGLQKEI